ncbi:type I-E CRISPR-associated protein Cas5/CasD [uncultured Aeromicrobium sp.]|uniref:type I-E CRISPR-associated protein Cas5/CasD n=1 Tax=uncultured Aeromicrobium sp. TaxID=337820 RepID=UPI0025FAC979|nr:type I-E CRISPR-associated protein Cas5/CasD [uncultured Aeromicrobium sp.]
MSDEATLLLRLAGPVQAWGARWGRRFEAHQFSKLSPRPRKSGLIGLLASAQGRPRGSDTCDLGALTMVVREDQPGEREGELLTRRDPAKPHTDGRVGTFLHDAILLAGISGDRATIEGLHAAMLAPVWAPYLGRRACPPAQPFVLGVIDGDAETVVRQHEWLARPHARRRMPQAAALIMEELHIRYTGGSAFHGWEERLPPVVVPNPTGSVDTDWMAELS